MNQKELEAIHHGPGMTPYIWVYPDGDVLIDGLLDKDTQRKLALALLDFNEPPKNLWPELPQGFKAWVNDDSNAAGMSPGEVEDPLILYWMMQGYKLAVEHSK